MASHIPKPNPSITDEGLPYWQAASRGELHMQWCPTCVRYQFPPRGRCANCWEGVPQWVRVSGTGTVYSFTVIHRAPTAAFKADVPYVLAIVELTEGTRLMCNIVQCDPGAVRIGQHVEVMFEDRGEGLLVPQFRPIKED